MKKESQPNYGWALVAGVLAWVIPGAGHILLHRTLRGLIIFVCITGLFWAGVGVGGVFTVDPLHEHWWFLGQMCTGASGGIAWARQQRERQAITAKLGIPPLPVPGTRGAESWGKIYGDALVRDKLALVCPADGVARAYSGIAGMLNLLCIFDAILLGLMGKMGEEQPPQEPPSDPASAKGGAA